MFGYVREIYSESTPSFYSCGRVVGVGESFGGSKPTIEDKALFDIVKKMGVVSEYSDLLEVVRDDSGVCFYYDINRLSGDCSKVSHVVKKIEVGNAGVMHSILNSILLRLDNYLISVVELEADYSMPSVMLAKARNFLDYNYSQGALEDRVDGEYTPCKHFYKINGHNYILYTLDNRFRRDIVLCPCDLSEEGVRRYYDLRVDLSNEAKNMLVEGWVDYCNRGINSIPNKEKAFQELLRLRGVSNCYISEGFSFEDDYPDGSIFVDVNDQLFFEELYKVFITDELRFAETSIEDIKYNLRIDYDSFSYIDSNYYFK